MTDRKPTATNGAATTAAKGNNGMTARPATTVGPTNVVLFQADQGANKFDNGILTHTNELGKNGPRQ